MNPLFFLRFLLIFIFTVQLNFQDANAHFGMVIPSDSMVTQGENANIRLALSFTHPFEQKGMNLAKPNYFGVIHRGKRYPLLSQLSQVKKLNHLAWQSVYRIRKPGIHTFYMEPEPYWEQAEDCFIIHYTKTVVAAFGDDQDWDREIGLKTEIVPVTRPFALYTHNLFQGIVKLNGKPVPAATVEVEYYNVGKKAHAPNEYMITQTIKADANGLFSYTVPKSGWWGFAALNNADYQLSFRGEKKDVELGAVIWVQFHDWISR
jgi:cobalt/nickel transport protein